MSRLNEALPGLDEALPGLDEALPGLDEALPGLDEALPGLDEALPGLDEALPGLDEALPGLDEALPGLDEALPGLDEALPGLDEALPGLDEALPGLDEALPGLDEALPGLDEVLPVLDEALPGLDEALPGLDEALPGLDEALPGMDEALPGLDTHDEYTFGSGQKKISSKGSYKTVIKIHSVGNSIQTALRWAINIDDVNTFVPMWVSIALLEAYQYGGAPRPSDEQLRSTLEFCNGNKDPNLPYNHSLLAFWPYYFDEEVQHFFGAPLSYMQFMNLANLVPNNNLFNTQNNVKSNVGITMEIFSQVSRILTETGNLKKIFMNVFEKLDRLDQSTDADDGFVWLGLGSMLNIQGAQFPNVRDTWNLYNSNISSVFDALKKYNYRPFSADPLVNTIDPISYYVLRDFLDEAKSSGKDVAIPTTWFTNIEEKLPADKVNPMHKIINNLDATVCSNVVNGITTSVLSGVTSPELFEDQELNQIYQNTTAMLVHFINSNFSNRPDLALTYYTSRYQFYWTVARTVSVIDIYKRKGNLPAVAMELVFSNLKEAMEGEATRFILADAKRNDDGSFYFDDFLGNGDLTEDNKPIIRGEDRIFTTAMAANVLMYTWLSFDSVSSQSFWKFGTPDTVKEIVDGCVLWLSEHAFEGKPWNAFFTTQNKGKCDQSFRYPANIFLEKRESYPFELVTTVQVAVGVQGYIPKNEYETMIDSTHFGKPTPTVFKGFNHPDFSDMVFWSSDPYTYAVTLLALSRYREITEAHIVTMD